MAVNSSTSRVNNVNANEVLIEQHDEDEDSRRDPHDEQLQTFGPRGEDGEEQDDVDERESFGSRGEDSDDGNASEPFNRTSETHRVPTTAVVYQGSPARPAESCYLLKDRNLNSSPPLVDPEPEPDPDEKVEAEQAGQHFHDITDTTRTRIYANLKNYINLKIFYEENIYLYIGLSSSL